MEAMQDAIEQTVVPINLESLKPSDEVIDGWRGKVKKTDIQNFLLGVVDTLVSTQCRN
jgi:hypothetical protein